MAGPVRQDIINAAVSKTPTAESQGLRLHHTAYRVKDPAVSLDFYTRILGMRLFSKIDLPTHKTTVFFIGYGQEKDNPVDQIQTWRDHTIELFHIWGSENIPDLKFSNGNEQSKGYGHICLAAHDANELVRALEKEGVTIIKRPWEGETRGQGFIQDPDGYYIEIISEISSVPGDPNPKLYCDMFKL